jgi:hypothetical protein
MCRLLVVMLLLVWCLAITSAVNVHIQKELVVPHPPWPYSHVCSIQEMNDGTIVAAFQAGTGEKNPDSVGSRFVVFCVLTANVRFLDY